ncbi:ATP-binding cassette domain-containing protein [Pedobacter lithocola]|uniref:ATP-binding cassette domain-containing protein n=1 Tax=Pedobacter lithocola TaxID=1908239 RepID=A0ABV8PAG8_9SPHI
MPGLFIDSVTKQFNQQAILNGVFINCKIGEVVGLLGRNGSGKSTLLKIIFGTVNPDFKHLKLDDKLISKGYLSKNISYLPQDNFIPMNLSVLQAIEMLCNTHRKDLLNTSFVSNNLNKKLRDFSGGECRLLEVLITIYCDAEYVLLDEPFSQLAPLLVDEIKIHIEKMKSLKGFIITDHYFQSILDISDRIILLHNGCNYQIQNRDDLILHGYLPDFKE